MIGRQQRRCGFVRTSVMLVLPITFSSDAFMNTSISKLTSKYQATIPEPVRTILGVAAGDAIAFDVVGRQVRLRKARPVDLAFSRALDDTLSEWTSKADEAAFRDL